MVDEVADCNASWIIGGALLENGSRETNNATDEFVKSLGISIGIFDIFLGSFGNFLTILAILGNRRLHSTFNSFILSLCFVDFCTATFMMPFNVASYATGTWPFGEDHVTCAIQAYVYYCCGYSSVVCLLVITVNRYIGILYPEKHDEIFTPKVIYLTIAISLAFAPVVMSVFFFIGMDGRPGYGWIDNYSLCVFRTDEENTILRRYMLLTRILFQCLPLAIMIVLYGKIFYTVRKSGQSVATMSLKSAEPSDGPKLPSQEDTDSDVGHIATLCKLRNRKSRSEMDVTKKMNLLAVPHTDKSYHNECLVVSCNHLDVQSSSMTAILQKIFKKPSAEEMTHCACHENQKASRMVTQVSPNVDKSASHNTSMKYLSVTPPLPKRGKRATYSTTSPASLKKNMGTIADTIRKRQKMDRKLLSISLAICLTFSVVFYPSVLVNLFPCSKYFSPNVHKCASIITWLNSCVNPIIYCFMNPKLRAEYKRLLRNFGVWILRPLRKDIKTGTVGS